MFLGFLKFFTPINLFIFIYSFCAFCRLAIYQNPPPPIFSFCFPAHLTQHSHPPPPSSQNCVCRWKTLLLLGSVRPHIHFHSAGLITRYRKIIARVQGGVEVREVQQNFDAAKSGRWRRARVRSELAAADRSGNDARRRRPSVRGPILVPLLVAIRYTCHH